MRMVYNCREQRSLIVIQGKIKQERSWFLGQFVVWMFTQGFRDKPANLFFCPYYRWFMENFYFGVNFQFTELKPISFKLLLDFSHCIFSLAKAQFLYKFLTFCKCTGKKGKKVVRGVVALSPHQVIIPTSFFSLEYPCTKAEVKWRMCLLRHVDLDLKVNVLGSHPALSCVLSDLRAHPVPGCLWHSWGCVWGWAWDMTLWGPIGSLQGLSHTFVFGAVAVLSLPSFPNKTGFPQNV